jgi:hypothetical protein
VCGQKPGALIDELVEGWRSLKQHMIASWQLDKRRIRDELCHETALLNRSDPIAYAVQNQRRDIDLPGQLRHVDLAFMVQMRKAASGWSQCAEARQSLRRFQAPRPA